jgi:hypothetical protein
MVLEGTSVTGYALQRNSAATAPTTTESSTSALMTVLNNTFREHDRLQEAFFSMPFPVAYWHLMSHSAPDKALRQA